MARKRERITTPSGFTFTLEEREGGRGWQVNFQREGKRVRFSVGRGGPEEARRRAVEEVEKHQRVAASGDDPPFAHVVAEMILLKEKSEKAPSYIRKIEEHFRLWIFPALGTSQPISSITAADLRNLRYQLGASDLEYRSVNRILTSLRQVFKFAEHERGYCSAPSLPRNFPEGAIDDAWQVLTPDEIGRVLSAAATEVRPLFAFIANTGLRVGSALATEVEWIDWAARIVRYPKDAMKGRRPHVVELNPEAEQALRTALTASPVKPFDFSYWFALKRWHVARAAAGFPTLRIHDLRHSYITALLDAGVPIHVVRDIAAHRDLHVTQHYAHSSDEARRRAAAKVRIAAPTAPVSPGATSGDTKVQAGRCGAEMKNGLSLGRTGPKNTEAPPACAAGPSEVRAQLCVPGAGIEPATRGFSVPCSTN